MLVVSNKALELYAPISGQTIDLELVPDPVFASKMVGDGLAIDPTSEVLLAPCDGVVKTIHSSKHALTLTHESGLEILIHIGLDTVSLKGEGFSPRINIGDKVTQGQPLISFDAALIAEKARSLITMFLVTNGDLIDKLEVNSGKKRAGKDTCLKVFLKSEAAQSSTEEYSAKVESADIEVLNPQGLHARPAAVLANLAKRFKSKIEIVRQNQAANCKSVVALMSLQVLKNDRVKFRAAGEDAQQAIKELSQALKEGLGEDISASTPSLASPAKLPSATPTKLTIDTNRLLHGVSASPGIAVGHIYQMSHPEYEVNEKGEDPQSERAKFSKAINSAKSELEFLENNMKAQADPNKAGIFAAHRELLDDPDLIEQTHESINSGKSAAFSWREAYTQQAENLSKLSHELMAARAADVRDIGERVLRLLIGEKVSLAHNYPEDTILIAEDLTPSDTATLDRSKVMGFATVLGGATSHVAILARSLDMPALAGINPKALNIANGTKVILNGNKGTLELDPSEEHFKEAQAKLKAQRERNQELMSRAQETATTKDGLRIEVVANIGSPTDAQEAVKRGAEGVGLLRSEFLFIGRATPPSEEEQADIYIQIAKTLGEDKPLIIRTLDVGGDKPLPYLPIPTEENPFLGERGIRATLTRPEILRTQFRAILRAADFAKVQVMLPMVTTIDEFRQAKAIFEEECKKVGKKAPLGVMIEIPAAALLSEVIAREADFFSIGTNDLTQYTMAIDRGHPKLAPMADGLSPAVLRLIRLTAQGAHEHNRKVGVCGGIGGDIQATAILIGLGIDELSVAAPAVPAIKERIRNLDMAYCRRLAEKALTCANAEEVRKLQEGIEL